MTYLNADLSEETYFCTIEIWLKVSLDVQKDPFLDEIFFLVERTSLFSTIRNRIDSKEKISNDITSFSI